MSKFESVKATGVRVNNRLFGEGHLVSTVVRTTYLAWLTALVLLAVVITMLVTPAPEKPDSTADFTTLSRVQFFATNFTTLWLTGTGSDAEAIRQMVGDVSILPGEWNREPVEVQDINVADIKSQNDGDNTEWVLTMGATLIPPGRGTPQRSYYDVTVIERGGTFRALTMPRLVHHARPELAAEPAYTDSVAPTSALGTAVANFITAYYGPDASGSLGRYVSSSFAGSPVADSPYSTVAVTEIKARNLPDPNAVAAGDTTAILATVKASLSSTTFHTLSVPMTVKRTDDGQWLIDSIEQWTKITGSNATHTATGD